MHAAGGWVINEAMPEFFRQMGSEGRQKQHQSAQSLLGYHGPHLRKKGCHGIGQFHQFRHGRIELQIAFQVVAHLLNGRVHSPPQVPFRSLEI
jgi:hypothetical protein